MATGGVRCISNKMIVRLAESISARNLELIAMKYLGIEWETLENLKRQHREDVQAFSRDVIRKWCYMNSGPDQIEVLASILYKAAREGGYVQPSKVQQILGLKQEEVALPETASAVTSGFGPQEVSTNESESDIPEELTELIDELQEYTEEAMKIEMAPWVQNYTVPMDELYTELTLAQIENKPTGAIPVKLDNYAQLFSTQETTDQQETSNIQQNISTPTRKGKRRKGKKILAKGDPGMGKSTLGRKIAYDWAKGVFTAVSVVFFVSVKLIRPGQSIENIIIEQVPPLEALEIGERKLKDILDSFGHKCLIILDGLDEHDLGTNDDVKKVIEGRKLWRCNIFLTSRPHSTEKIEKHFSTHVIVSGFSGIRAKQFLSNCLHNSGKVQKALSFSVRNSLSQSSPMLLLFLSILVNTNELDLARDYVCLSEMYFRLVRCVYRKYCERIKLEFQESKFVDVLKRVGKVAWKMWKSGKVWAKKSEILKEVGEDAFEIGLLIGHRDYRLSRDETADILITFPHQTILEFLGSYGFLHMLNEGDSIESLFDNEQERYKVMQYPSFLQFCLWFLEGSCKGEKFEFRKSVYESIVTHCAKEINFEQLDMLDMGKLLPVLKVPFIHNEKNRPLLKFLQAILSKCDKTREFYLHSVSYYPSESFSPLLPNIPPVSLEFENKTKGKSVTILERASNYGALGKVLDSCDAAGLKICLFLLCDTDIDVSKVLHHSLEKLSLCGHPQIMPLVTLVGDLSPYPFLKELSVLNVRVHWHVFYILHGAVKSEKLPSLSHLHFEGFRIITQGSVNARQVGLDILQLLFSPLWSRLTHFTLDFRNAFITIDTETFRDFFSAERNKWFQRLSSLSLHSREGLCLPLKSMFQIPLPTIKSLKLHNVSEKDYEAICSVVNDGNLPCLADLNISMRESDVQNSDSEATDDTVGETSARSLDVVSFSTLTHLTLKSFVRSLVDLNTVALSAKRSSVSCLDISHSQGITGVLSDFLSYRFPQLDTLILSNCGLNRVDLDSLAKASVEGRLPELKHLDLSDNEAIRGQWRHLFSHGQQWKDLLSLNVKQDVQFHEEYHDLVHAVQLGALPNLRHISLSSHNAECLQKCLSVTWPSVDNIDIRSALKHNSNEHVQLYQQVVTAVERGSLPQLHILSVTSKFVPKYIDHSSVLNSLDDMMAYSTAQIQLHELNEACSSLLTTSLSTETSESYISYLQGLQNVNLAMHLASIAEHMGNYFNSKFFRMIYQFPGDSFQQPFDLQKIRGILHESLEVSETAQSERMRLKSIIDISCQNGQSFLDGEPLDLMPVSSQLQDWLDTIDDVPPVDLSLFKSLVEIGCKNLQCASNGQPLDLQPVCPLLKEWFARSSSINDQVRPLLKSVVDAVESVLVGSQSNFKSASSEIYDLIENVLDSPKWSASERSLFKFITDVFCTFLNCFFTEPLDLQPVSRLMHEWIDTSSDKYIDPSEFPADHRTLKCAADGVLTFVECAFNRPFSLLPVCDVLHKWIDTSPGLSECDKSNRKWFADVCCMGFQQILSGKLQTLFSVVPEVDPSLVNRILSPDGQNYLRKLSSEQLTNSINSNLIRVLKYQLRKRGIRVYAHFSVSER